VTPTRSRRVALADLASRHAAVAERAERETTAVLRSGRWIGGETVARAEAAAAAFLGRRGAVGVASGTDALVLALQALGVGHGDEVIVPALTFFATAGAVRATGADVVVADVREDGLLDEEKARALVGPRTRAIVPVHLFGSVASAPNVDLAVVDDAAQAVGATPLPSCGRLTAISAYPTKTWGAAGDAGFVAGDDPELLDRVRRLGTHGATAPHLHDLFGGHAGRASRLDAVQAAVLLAHAPLVSERVARRRAIAARYDRELPPGMRSLARSEGSAVLVYAVLAERRAALQDELEAAGIESAVYYPRPLDRQPALRSARSGPTPTASWLCDRLLALPVHEALEPQDVDRVLEVLWAHR
jgi:dTDP-4-amino-4,6-dideoxygalactose transaminase